MTLPRPLLAVAVAVATLAAASPTPRPAPRATVALVGALQAGGGERANAEARAALEGCARTYGVTTRTAFPGDATAREGAVILQGTQNTDVTITLGEDASSAVEAAARRFPQHRFVVVGGAGHEPNIEALRLATEQSSYLAGALAALMSHSGRVAFLGGSDVAPVRPARAGFIAGARAARPGLAVDVVYTGSFADPDTGTRTARGVFARGADVVYVVAGRAGLGAIAAARAAGRYAIGSDVDQDALAPGTVLTSAVTHVGVAVDHACAEAASHKTAIGDVALGLADGAVGLTDFRYTKARIGAARLARLRALREAIVNGRVTVPNG